jgi:LPXTG-site transpeptidase (sortase) family protein
MVFNWGKISWIFHPGYLSRMISFYFFEKPSSSQKIKPPQLEKEKFENEIYYQKEDSIEIEKIKISAPLISVGKESEVKKALDRGVVLWPNSARPGENGQTIILGHSAPPNWPKIKYDWVFSNLNLLEKGDEIVIYFKNKKYIYRVEDKFFLNRGQELPKINSEKSILFLISCWPPGKDLRRIAVFAIQK